MLAKPIQVVLREFGLDKLTEPQERAIPNVLKGENLLLVAPTGSGKTEAVILPIFSQIIKDPNREGISALYITPLRALNRDMIARLSTWGQKLDIKIQVRHGDTETKIRRKQSIHPPDVLITTPETLQAILPGSLLQKHLSHVKYVIIDEVHQIAPTKRGIQLAVALERLVELTATDFQRIGLSATVADPHKVAEFIAGVGRPIRIIEVRPPKSFDYSIEYPTPIDSDYDLAQNLKTSPEAASRIRRILDLIQTHTSTLVFVNSRTNAEMLGHKLNMLTDDIAVHHGSLSKEERRRIEDEFKANILKAIICTSTMELGVDIGQVDLVIQYLSPRQVGSLIQRVGRSGHRLDLISKGIIITAYSEDSIESLAAAERARDEKLESLFIHENALDVLAHQIAGILMDKRDCEVNDALKILHRSYPYRKLETSQFLEVVDFLDDIRELNVEGVTLKRAWKTRDYYYGNLSMIPDERRYPIIDIVSDRRIGTLGDEFMALRVRLGLDFICRGKVWRIVQIEDETGTVYVVPSEDHFGSIPGWDGEMIPIPFDLAVEVGRLRGEIAEELNQGRVDQVAETFSKKLKADKNALLEPIKEIKAHLEEELPLPTPNHILLEAFDKYIIVHSCYGEIVNRTLGSVFDAVLSNHDLIIGWWNDGYRILIEAPRKVDEKTLEKVSNLLFSMSPQKIEEAFNDYIEARFPFSYKMKFVAERFGVLPRGKTMGPERMESLPSRFKNTPIYDETLREALIEKVDLKRVKQTIRKIHIGKIKVCSLIRLEKPTPLAYHILAKHLEVTELMAPKHTLLSNIEKMKKSIQARTVRLFCVACGNAMEERRIRQMSEAPTCENCNSQLLGRIKFGQSSAALMNLLERRKNGDKLTSDELRDLTYTRRTADLTLSYGKKAIIALQVKGVGPETASRILGKMHPNTDDFYTDLLEAKIQYIRTKPYWNERKQK